MLKMVPVEVSHPVPLLKTSQGIKGYLYSTKNLILTFSLAAHVLSLLFVVINLVFHKNDRTVGDGISNSTKKPTIVIIHVVWCFNEHVLNPLPYKFIEAPGNCNTCQELKGERDSHEFPPAKYHATQWAVQKNINSCQHIPSAAAWVLRDKTLQARPASIRPRHFFSVNI